MVKKITPNEGSGSHHGGTNNNRGIRSVVPQKTSSRLIVAAIFIAGAFLLYSYG